MRRLVHVTAIGTGVFCAMTIALVVAGQPLPFFHAWPGEVVVLGMSIASVVAFSTVGLIIVRNGDVRAIGWLFVLGGFGRAAALFFRWYQRYGEARACGAGDCERDIALHAYADWLATWLSPLALGLTAVLLLLVFPDGRLVSRRWRIAAGFAVSAVVIGSAGSIVGPGPLQGGRNNPFAIDAAVWLQWRVAILGNWVEIWVAAFYLALVIAAASLVRRAIVERGERRQQVKWVAVGAAFAAAARLAGVLLYAGAGWRLGDVSRILAHLGEVALAVAVLIAILKYRLWGIDVVIRRAILFGGLSMFITLVYGTIVVGIGSLVPRETDPLTLPLLATVASTAGFQPARERTQRLADRIVFGERAIPYGSLTSLAQKMHAAVSLDDIGPLTVEAVGRAIGARSVLLHVLFDTESALTFRWPQSIETTITGPSLSIPIGGPEEQLADMHIELSTGGALTERDRQILGALSAQATIALRGIQLNEKLRRQAQDLVRNAELIRQSRVRLERAEALARRNVQDAIRLRVHPHLDRLQSVLKGRAPEPLSAVRAAASEARDALDQVREISHGLAPPMLSEAGLAIALKALVAREAPTVAISVDHRMVRARLPASVERAMYIVCAAGIAGPGVGAHRRLNLRLERTPTDVRAVISGFDAPLPVDAFGDDFLSDMTDRLDALGGSLEVRVSAATGATLEARLPVVLSEGYSSETATVEKYPGASAAARPAGVNC